VSSDESLASDERRRHPRFDVAAIPGVLDGYRTFETLKLSAGGLLIRLPAELSLDQRVRIELRLGGEPFRSQARVVFVGPDLSVAPRGDELYRVGLALDGTPPEAQVALERFIARELAAAAGDR
jgi:hypothetical protein